MFYIKQMTFYYCSMWRLLLQLSRGLFPLISALHFITIIKNVKKKRAKKTNQHIFFSDQKLAKLRLRHDLFCHPLIICRVIRERHILIERAIVDLGVERSSKLPTLKQWTIFLFIHQLYKVHKIRLADKICLFYRFYSIWTVKPLLSFSFTEY